MALFAFRKPEAPIGEDPFVARFLARLPPGRRHSFSAEQLLLIKMAFGAREWGEHAVDIRRTFRLWGWRFYIVFLLGADRRTAPRPARALGPRGTMVAAVFLAMLIVTVALCAFALLYAAKRTLGIDLVPGIDMLDDRFLERLLGLR